MKKKLMVLLSAMCALCLSAGIFAACQPADPGSSGNNGGTSGTPSQPNPPTQPTQQSEVTSLTFGDVRVQLLSDTIVRIEQKGPEGFEDRPSYIVTNRTDWEPVEYTQASANGETTLKTANYIVHIPDNASAESVYITSAEGDALYNYGGMTDTNVYLPSPSDELQSWYFTDSPRIIPSEYGYSVNEDGGILQDWDFDNDATDIFVFLPLGDYEQFANDYIDVTGESEMVSLQMLGFWDSRWYAYSAETALQQIKDYTDRGYSIDVLVIDTDWRNSGATGGVGYDINTDLFPDMAGFLDDCHDLGVNIIFNDHPEPVTSGNGLDKEEVAYRNENLTLILSLGLDYWWYDRNWSVALNSCDPDISVYAFGMYAYNWVTQEYLESITDLNEYAERALIMGNVDGCLHGKWNYASDLSAHRYTIQWTGDIGSTSDALAQEIYAAVFGGAEVGIPFMSSDIGGHTQAVTDEMYVRWFQYGALSSILRVHCTRADYIGEQEGRMPWLFGDTAEEVAHVYMDMRYRLLPLYYCLARDNYESGLPVMQRLDIEYPQYVEASRNDEYLLGDYILVAPIAEATPTAMADDSQLTHTADGGEVPGLVAEYYNNTTWSGNPVRTQVDANIGFDWGTSGPAGLGSDNFSIIWRGNITIGAQPAQLMFFADDTVIVYIDGEKVVDSNGTYDNYLKTSKTYEAGTTHSIEVQYVEEGGNAHIYMYYVEANAAQTQYNSRTVFIPTGTWIDVWTGETFVGPRTVTVSHPLTTSPIFVREGALIALAPNMVNTSAETWSELTLDVYPSTNFEAGITLYEDDTTTVAYKHGEYRKTDVTMTYAGNNTILVNIGAAVGEFEGNRAFTERTWNVRVHVYDDWGSVSGVRINGRYVSIEEFAKSADAEPFAFSGAAADSGIAEFSFTGSVKEAYEIEIIFTSTQETDVNEDYDDTAVGFTLTAGEAGGSADFDALGTLGWTAYGEGSAEFPVNKAGVAPLINYTGSYDTPWIVDNNFFNKTYTDGSGTHTSASAIASQKDFSIELTTTGQKAYYILYVGGNQCTAKITVRDRAGNVSTEMFGNIDGRFLRRIVIEVEEGPVSTLYITYSALASETAGTGTPTYLTLLGGFVSETLPEVGQLPETTAEAEIVSSETPDAVVNLSDAGRDLGAETLDWAQFSDNGNNPERRLYGEGIDSVVFASGAGFGDYSASIMYSDGSANGAHTGTRNGTCTSGYITANFTVTPNVQYIRLYTGTYQSENVVEVYDQNGELLAQAQPFSATSVAVTRVVTIAVSVEEEESIIVIIRSMNAGTGGNVSLAAVALLGQYAGESPVTAEATREALPSEVDLTERGSSDWMYVVGNASKEGGAAISALTFSSYINNYNDYAATFSYLNGSTPATGTDGRECDFVRFTVTVDEDTDYIELYVSAMDGASAGVVILDEAGRAVLRAEPVTSSSGKTCAVIRIAVDAAEEETLTFMCYKGGNAGGKFGLAAIAVGEAAPATDATQDADNA